MGREIEFDYDKAIDRATRVFWKNGYSRTSVRELLKAMQIGEGSFYNTIKSKKNLYLECLKHYCDTVGRERESALFSETSVKRGVRALFKTMLDQLENPKSPGMCLMANSISRDVLDSSEFRQFITGQIAAFGMRFTERIKSAKETGELSKELQPEIVCRIIGTYSQGLQRSVLIAFDRKQIERQIEVFLTGLGF